MPHGLSNVTRAAKVHGAPPDVMHDTTDPPSVPTKTGPDAQINGGTGAESLAALSAPPTAAASSSTVAASSQGGVTAGSSSKRRVEQLQEMVLERELRRIELEEKKLIVETEKLELEKENLELERQKLQLEIGKLQANLRYSHPTSLY